METTMITKDLAAGVIAFVLSAAIGLFLVPFLRNLKIKQTERIEGVQSHLKKAGTPTMGGLMFLVSITVTTLVICPIFQIPFLPMLPVLLLTLGFGLIGFYDDFLKVILRRSDGLIAWQKLLLEIVVTTIFVICMNCFTDISLALRIPFMNGFALNIGFLAYPLLYFAVIGTVNGVNFTDGLDGLASCVTVVVAVFFTMAALRSGSGISPITAAVVGALLGFLLYNHYPAKIFMGDTGSLALGGFVAGAAYMLEMPIFIVIVGMIYLVEVISVMIQVTYFKATHGKRFFKMAPIHHHFELCGWSEIKIVAIFTLITAVLCVIAYIAM